MTWIRKKYTRTFVMDAQTANDNAALTISLVAAKNANDPTATISIADVA